MGEGHTWLRHFQPQHLLGAWYFSLLPVLASAALRRSGFEEQTGGTSPVAASPLGPHVLFEFICLQSPAFGSCYLTGLNHSSLPLIFSPSRNSQASCFQVVFLAMLC